jgi:hypothetical protein
MKSTVRWVVAGGVVSALAVWLLAAGAGSAADDDQVAREGVLKVADLIQKKDMDTARKQAQTIAQKINDPEPIMNTMSPREDGGLGVGAQPGAIKPDGIEKKLLEIDKTPLKDQQAAAEAGALQEMAFRIAAVATMAQSTCPVPAKQGKKDPKDWKKWTEDMQKQALELADAAKGKKAAEINKAVKTLNNTCATCHAVFKDS